MLNHWQASENSTNIVIILFSNILLNDIHIFINPRYEHPHVRLQCAFLALSCGEPPLIEYADKPLVVSYSVASTATYECWPGYRLDIDDSSIQCLPTQNWSEAPDCVRE